MTSTETRILQRLFDGDFIALSNFSERDKIILRQQWGRGEVHFDESRKLFSITPAGVNALGRATMPATPSAPGTVILTIDAKPPRKGRAA